MRIEKGGENYVIVEDKAISEEVSTQFGSAHVRHQIKVIAQSKRFSHTAKAGDRAHCLKGLLDSGFQITKEPGDPETF